MNKKLTTAISLGLVSAMCIAGTIAYYQTEDQDINVMKNGNIKVVQTEYERMDTTGKLQEFTQGKTLYPVFGTLEKSEGWELDGLNGNNVLYANSKNVQDKLVFVENTGKNSIYYRTIIAVEAPQGVGEKIKLNKNEDENLSWSEGVTTTINGVNYVIYEATYKKELSAGETSIPSLLQAYLAEGTTNKEVEAFGDSFEILVATQATDTAQYDNANEALDKTFGDITAANHPWINGVKIPTIVSTVSELQKALSAGENVTLESNIKTSGESLTIPEGKTVNINLNGYKIENNVKIDGEISTGAITNHGNLTIENGTVVNKNLQNHGAAAILNNGGTLVLNNVNAGSDSNYGAAVETYGGNVTVNGGLFAGFDRGKNTGVGSYVFINDGGTMTVNNAKVDGKPKGIFAAGNGGKTEVNGGYYRMNKANAYYIAYSSGNNSSIKLNSGTYMHDTTKNRPAVCKVNNGEIIIDKSCVLEGTTWNE